MADPTLYLYTSLTAGSSHIVTATARLETILKANKLPFRAIDVATDDAARKLWGRRSKGKKLPGLVKFGSIVGDLEQIEEWNEYGELRMQIDSVDELGSIPATVSAAKPDSATSVLPPASESLTPKPSTIKIQNPPAKETQKDSSISAALRQAGEEAAAKAKENSQAGTKKEPAPATADKQTSAPSEEKQGGSGEETVRRKSVAPEIAEIIPGRPPLVPEVAAESSANFHADNIEALGLIDHHRGSNIPTNSKEEEKIAQDLRKFISGDCGKPLDSLKDDQMARVGPDDAAEKALEN